MWYISQIEDLQLSLARQEKEQSRREDVLRQEIADLQQVTIIVETPQLISDHVYSNLLLHYCYRCLWFNNN